METTKLNRISTLLLVFALVVMSISYAVSSNPSQPTSIETTNNMTASYPDGTMLNGTRGYIYNITVNESQPTQKWVGYVGNINGEYALQDATGNALYDWSIVTIVGELYATKEGPFTGDYDTVQAGGIPVWADLTCANSSMLYEEGVMFNHTYTDEDSYNNTFLPSFSSPGFYAGENQILEDDCIGACSSCSGVFLNKNNADQSTDWAEVVLTDQTWQNKSVAEDTVRNFDIIYAALLENNTAGFNGEAYDFQMLLPQSGLQGDRPNVAFYFYIELI